MIFRFNPLRDKYSIKALSHLKNVVFPGLVELADVKSSFGEYMKGAQCKINKAGLLIEACNLIDLRRQTSETRKATIIGGGSMNQNLQFPPMMGESYFIYQIISDDGNYRGASHSDVTFFPCGQ